jgi:cardiolipin synthase (CMP-forming)
LAGASLNTRKLLGLDRSGPPPPETRRQQPLRPWTAPNAVGYARLALIPVFVVVAFSAEGGRSVTATVIFGVVAVSDYLDGLVARLTGQYSRLGALLDPLTDRVLVVSGVVVDWHFELLPRWGLAVLAARELVMLVLTQLALRRAIDLEINWIGRLAVWPTMAAVGGAPGIDAGFIEVMFYVGLAMTLAATALYLQDGVRRLRSGVPSSST